jgi:hypothetical protein
MKKSLLLFIFLSIYSITKAQVFITGIKGAYNTTLLMNDFEETPFMHRETELSFGYNIGVDFKYYFNKRSYYSNTFYAVATNPSYQVMSQKYNGLITDTLNQTSTPYKLEYNFSSFELPLMLYIRGQAGLYAEIGGSYGIIQTAKATYTVEGMDSISFSNADAKQAFTKNNISAIFGFGIDSEITPELMLTIGLRGTYGLLDLNSSSSRDAGIAETHTVVGGLVVGLSYRFDSYHTFH